MPNPPNYTRHVNFSNDEARGLNSPAPAKVDVELDSIQEALTDLRRVVIGITTATGALKPNVAVNASVSEIRGPQEEVAVGGSPETFVITPVIDLTYNSAHVYQNGLLLPSSDYTLAAGSVQISTTAGDDIAIHFFDSEDAILAQLADDTAPDTAGAGLVGWDDQNVYSLLLPITGNPNTVNDALDLAYQNIISIYDDMYPLEQWLRSDGTQPLTATWNTGGYSIGGLPASAVNGQAVRHEQLTALNALIANLSSLYLLVDGTSSMTNDLDFGGNKGINVTDGADAADAVNFTQLELQMPLDGSRAATANLNFGGFTATALADGAAATDAATVGQLTTAVSAVSTSKTEIGRYIFTRTAVYGAAYAEVSAGVYDITMPTNTTGWSAECVGGGGGGASSENDSRSGGGGGGGAFATAGAVTTGGTIIRITVGGGGSAQTSVGSPGFAGSASSVTTQDALSTYCTAGAGQGGYEPSLVHDPTNGGEGGAGGTGIGDYAVSGQAGFPGNDGVGGTSAGGLGGIVNMLLPYGLAATYGTGGTGGEFTIAVTGQAGQDGAVIIRLYK